MKQSRVPLTPNPQPPIPSVLIIGIGSPFGDDAAGLEAARRLESMELPAGTRVIAADRPGVDLISMFGDAQAVILIDAVRSGKRPGGIYDLDLAEIPFLDAELVSSHGLGVAEAIELARRLGCLPARGRLLGIEVADHGRTIEQPLTATVSVAIDRLVRSANKWSMTFATKDGDVVLGR